MVELNTPTHVTVPMHTLGPSDDVVKGSTERSHVSVCI